MAIAHQPNRQPTIRIVPIPIYRKQKEFLDSRATFTAFVGGRGAGKSFIGAYKLLKEAKPKRFYLVGGPTFQQLGDTTVRSFFQVGKLLGMFDPHADKPIGRWNGSSLHATLRNGAEIIFRSADNPERFRGPNLSGLWLDECSLYGRDAYRNAIACLREGDFGSIGEMGWQFATFTPKGKRHWTYEVFGKPDPITGLLPSNKCLIQARSAENPFLPETYCDEIRREFGPMLAPQELGGEFIDLEGLLFKATWLRYYWQERGYYWYVKPNGRQITVQKDELAIFGTMDLASSTKTRADYTVLGIWGMTRDHDLLLLDLIRDRMEAPAMVNTIVLALEQWRPDFLGMEEDGQKLFMQIMKTSGLPIRALKTGGKDKVFRAIPATVRMSDGQVFLPDRERDFRPWMEFYLDELLTFPEGVNDDQVDVTSYACGHASGMAISATAARPRLLGGGLSMSGS